MYTGSVSMIDSYGRTVTKTYKLRGADFAAADASMTNIVTELEKVTGARIIQKSVSRQVEVTDTATAGSNRDEGVTLVVLNSLGEKSNLKIPAPESGYLDANGNVDITHADIVSFTNLFKTGQSAFIDRDLNLVSVISGQLDK